MKRRKLKIKSVVILFIGIALIVASIFIAKNTNVIQIKEKSSVGYLASSNYKLDLYQLTKNEESEEETFEKKLEIVRGEKIEYYDESIYVNYTVNENASQRRSSAESC